MYKKPFKRTSTFEQIKIFESEFNLEDTDLFEETVVSLYAYIEQIFYLRDDIKKLIYLINPKIIVFENAYNPLFLMIVGIAKELGVVTVEMQHGHYDKNHIAFNVLQQSIQVHKQEINYPDYMFVYGNYYKNCARYFQGKESIFTVGNSFYEKMALNKDKEEAPCYDLLFVSSTSSKRIRDFAMFISKAYSTKKILYRLHPEEDISEQEINRLKQCGIIIEYPSERNIYASLNDSKRIVTYNSTVTYEAIGIGKCVGVIVDEYNELDYHLKSVVYTIPNEEALCNFVKMDEKITLYDNINTEMFFAHNSENKIRSAIKKIFTKRR